MNIHQHMDIWKKKEPWFYSDLVFNKRTYFILSSAIVVLVLSCLFHFSFACNVLASVVGYFLSQFIFQFGHMTTHALYIESPPEEWEPGVFVAFLHHYVRPKAIYEYWLNHRLNFLMQSKGSAVAYGYAWLLPFLFFGKELYPLYCWFLFWFAMIEPVHEWYHVPKEDRAGQFNFVLYFALTFLTCVGLLNEEHHKAHHQHSRKEMDTVTKFSDLYFPFSDSLFDWLWRNALSVRDMGLFKTNPIRKGIYAQGIILIPLTFTLSSYLFWLGK